jgi:hypothetical protein
MWKFPETFELRTVQSNKIGISIFLAKEAIQIQDGYKMRSIYGKINHKKYKFGMK